jgi:hypothetical protein
MPLLLNRLSTSELLPEDAIRLSLVQRSASSRPILALEYRRYPLTLPVPRFPNQGTLLVASELSFTLILWSFLQHCS